MAAILTQDGSLKCLTKVVNAINWQIKTYTGPATVNDLTTWQQFVPANAADIDMRTVSFVDPYLDEYGRAVTINPADTVFQLAANGGPFVVTGTALGDDDSGLAFWSAPLTNPTTGAVASYTFTQAGQKIRVRYRLSLHTCLGGGGTVDPPPGTSPGWIVEAPMSLNPDANGSPTLDETTVGTL